MCVIYVIWLCTSRIGLGWAHDAFTITYHMLMHFHAYILYVLYIVIYWTALGLFWLSLSLSLSLFCLLLWHPNASLLCPRTLFVPRHPLLLILHPLTFDSVMRRPNWTSLRTFLDKGFIQNAKSFCRTSPTLTFPLSSTVGNGSHCVTSRSPIHLCWSRSFTPTCMDLIIQYLFLLLAFEVRA